MAVYQVDYGSGGTNASVSGGTWPLGMINIMAKLGMYVLDSSIPAVAIVEDHRENENVTRRQ
jgi:hypothetical protein